MGVLAKALTKIKAKGIKNILVLMVTSDVLWVGYPGSGWEYLCLM